MHGNSLLLLRVIQSGDRALKPSRSTQSTYRSTDQPLRSPSRPHTSPPPPPPPPPILYIGLSISLLLSLPTLPRGKRSKNRVTLRLSPFPRKRGKKSAEFSGDGGYLPLSLFASLSTTHFLISSKRRRGPEKLFPLCHFTVYVSI